MAALDFSDVLLDQDFQDTFTFVRTTRAIGSGGVPVDTPALPVLVSAIVYPDPSSLIRQADGSRLAASITIATIVPLTSGWVVDDTSSVLADVITWHGRSFTCRSVSDGSAFGPGFYVVACDLLPLNPTS